MVNLDNSIQSGGDSVTIHDISKVTYKKRGDATETDTDISTVAIIFILSYKDKMGIEGIIRDADALGRFQVKDATYLTQDNYVTHNNIKYRMTNIIPKRTVNQSILYYEVLMKKVEE
ncbi:MAG: hypothetical protein ACTSQY_00985 [Candidatus Odinarchaeia archaeon]